MHALATPLRQFDRKNEMDDESVRYDGWMAQNRELARKLGEAIWAFALVERATYRYMKKRKRSTNHALPTRG